MSRLQLEMSEVQRQEADFKQKEKELKEKEKVCGVILSCIQLCSSRRLGQMKIMIYCLRRLSQKAAWNIDTICHDGKSKTVMRYGIAIHRQFCK